MTETEWLTCGDPNKMLEFLWNGVSDRKLRMFAAAWACAYVMILGTDEPLAWRAIEACEQFADGTISEEELVIAQGPVFDTLERCGEPKEGSPTPLRKAMAAICFASKLTIRKVISQLACLLGHPVCEDRKEDNVGILRDIFGNPFCPVTCSPDWRTETVLSLARQMYKARDFSAMPILADALQDAGCESDEILNHCRGPGPHVRGCWAVDLLLEKA